MVKIQNRKLQYCSAISVSHYLREAHFCLGFFWGEIIHTTCNLKNVVFHKFEVLKLVLLKILTKLYEKTLIFFCKIFLQHS